jgi:hypothetical protein
LAWRNGIAPVVNVASMLAFPLFIVGLMSASLKVLMDVGIVFFSLAVIFHLITLPVEFNASHRAIALLGSEGYLEQDELGSARKVLTAAAWTYVAAATMAIMNLARLLILRGNRD